IRLTQFYNVEIDNDLPFHIFGSVQDSGSYRVALDLSKGRDTLEPLAWQSVSGGEGSNFAIDPANPNIFYSHQYYGTFMRNDLSSATSRRGQSIMPKPPAGEPPLRGEWMAPII